MMEDKTLNGVNDLDVDINWHVPITDRLFILLHWTLIKILSVKVTAISGRIIQVEN